MQGILFWLFSLFAAFLYLFASAAMLYRQLIRRWASFTVLFFVVFPLCTEWFFGRVPGFYTELLATFRTALPEIMVFLVLAGTVACIGVALFRHYCLSQTIGLVACYFVALSTLGFAGGAFHLPPVNLDAVAMSAPFILFYIGLPAVFGWILLHDYSIRAASGLVVLFLCVVVVLAVGLTNFLNQPFLFVYALSPAARFWIELGTVGIGIIGFVVIVAYGFFNPEWPVRTTIGSLVIFSTIMAAVLLLVQLTMGLRILPALFSAASH